MASVYELHSLGIDYQAQAVLAYVCRMVHWPRDGQVLAELPRLRLTSSALINGRERHAAIIAQVDPGWPAELVSFGESRNTDNIVVQVTRLARAPFNQPTCDDLTDESYSARKEFSHGKVGEAAEAVVDAIWRYFDEVGGEDDDQ